MLKKGSYYYLGGPSRGMGEQKPPDNEVLIATFERIATALERLVYWKEVE